MSNKNIKPVISINLRKPVIRISKDTLTSIGNPEYVLFLVNPKDCSLGILPSDKNDVKAHHLSRYSNRKSLELHSKALIENLRKLCPAWESTGTYRMEGYYTDNPNIIKFNMAEAVELRGINEKTV